MLPTRSFSGVALTIMASFIAVSATAKVSRLRAIVQGEQQCYITLSWDQESGKNPIILLSSDTVVKADKFLLSVKGVKGKRSKGMNVWKASFKKMVPNKVYYFRIKDSKSMSKLYSIKTLPKAPSKLSIIAGGDSRNNRKARRRANLMVKKMQPHLVLFDGDFTQRDGSIEWKNWMDDWQCSLGPEGRITPLIIARGNHESDNKTLTEVFGLEAMDLYYKVNVLDGFLSIITLNTEVSTNGDQLKWLQQILSNDRSKWKITQYHRPIRPHVKKKREGNGQYSWAKLFEQYNVQLVVECDAHVHKVTYPIITSSSSKSAEGFERNDDKGVVYIGEGGWGAPLRKPDDDKKWTKSSASVNQVKWLVVGTQRMEVYTLETEHADQMKQRTEASMFKVPANNFLLKGKKSATIKL